MAIILLPTDFAFKVADYGWMDFAYSEVSDSNGDSADRLGGPPRWTAQLQSLDEMTPAEAGRWSSLILKLRGGVNHLAVYDPVRRFPEGTMRGAPVLAANVPAGATSAPITATGTLRAGDLLQFGSGVGTSQLISLVDDVAEVAGTITAVFEAPTRYAFAAGTPVTWDHPRWYGKNRGGPSSWNYPAGFRGVGGYRLDLVESW